MSKVPWLHWILIPSGATFHPFFSYDQQFPRYNVAQNQKCTEWNQNEFKHSTDKSNLYALNTYPGDANSFHFALRQKYLRDTRLLKTKNMHYMTSGWPWTLNCQRYPVSTRYLPQGSKFHFFSLYNYPFRDKQFQFFYLPIWHNIESEIFAKVQNKKKSKTSFFSLLLIKAKPES